MSPSTVIWYWAILFILLLVLSGQLNHYQEGDGPSYFYAILLLEFTPSYRTLLVLRPVERQKLACTKGNLGAPGLDFGIPEGRQSGLDGASWPSALVDWPN